MTEQILRREGENLLNEAGEVVARFEANNIIKVGAGGSSIKMLEYVGTGVDESPITFPDTPTFILGIHSITNTGAKLIHFGVPFINNGTNVPGLMRYIDSGDGTQNGYYNMSDNTLIVKSFADIGARLNQSGQHSTIYYI